MKPSGGGNFTPLEPVPQGNHVGILYQIIELGTVEEEYQGETKHQYKVQLTWELSDILNEFEDKETGEPVSKPRVISKDYTLSAHEKSALRLMLESWRGKKFSDDEAAEFDLTKLLGKPCMVNVSHTIKGDRTYANITAITGIPSRMTVPDQFNGSRYLSYDEWDWELFNSLPEFIRKKIESTPEFKALDKPHSAPSKPSNGHPDGHPAPKRDAKGAPVTKPQATGWNKKAKVELTEPVGADTEPDDLTF